MSTLPDMFHPWRLFGDQHPDWEVRFVDLPDGVAGETDTHRKVIWIDVKLSQAERRSTLAHEAIHAAAEHVACDPTDELEVEQAAARLLLPLESLLRVLPWAVSVGEAAEELWVDVDMLSTRLQHLHPSERHAIRRAFAARDNEEPTP